MKNPIYGYGPLCTCPLSVAILAAALLAGGVQAVRAAEAHAPFGANNNDAGVKLDLVVDGLPERSDVVPPNDEENPGAFVPVDETWGNWVNGSITLTGPATEGDLTWTANEGRIRVFEGGNEWFGEPRHSTVPATIDIQIWGVAQSDALRDTELEATFTTEKGQEISDRVLLTIWDVVSQDRNNNDAVLPMYTPTNTVVGRQISLRGKVRPDGVPLQAREWTIPGDTVKTYTHTVQRGWMEALGPTDLDDVEDNGVIYYWKGGTAPGAPITIQVMARVKDRQLTQPAPFVVLRPDAAMVSLYTTNRFPPPPLKLPGIQPPPPDPPAALAFGALIANNDGIMFTGTWVDTTPCAAMGQGEVCLVQLGTSVRTWHVVGDGTWGKATGADPYLDEAVGIHYGGEIAVAANQRRVLPYRADTPYEPVAGRDDLWVHDSFTTYLMFKPAGANSIWVSLRSLAWQWQARATLGAGGWGVTNAVPVEPAPPPAGVDTTNLPLWEDYLGNLPTFRVQ